MKKNVRFRVSHSTTFQYSSRKVEKTADCSTFEQHPSPSLSPTLIFSNPPNHLPFLYQSHLHPHPTYSSACALTVTASLHIAQSPSYFNAKIASSRLLLQANRARSSQMSGV